ncbi:MAG TPA: hypothetical protein VEM13_07545 [Gemmatimonadales bacterium]|nr:hypothetical protein [Gemmatimonadales bacterium]
MAQQKYSADQLRRIEEIQEFQHTVAIVKHLVAELDANRAAATRTIQQLSERIAKETSQLRQRTLTANIGTIGDVAGAMSVMAGRGGGLNMKIRGLTDGVNSLSLQLDLALKHAMTPEPKKPA